jgi:hypothetical protein
LTLKGRTCVSVCAMLILWERGIRHFVSKEKDRTSSSANSA